MSGTTTTDCMIASIDNMAALNLPLARPTQKVVRNALDENKHLMLEFYEKHDPSCKYNTQLRAEKISKIASMLENFSISELLDEMFDKYCDAPALREWRTGSDITATITTATAAICTPESVPKSKDDNILDCCIDNLVSSMAPLNKSVGFCTITNTSLARPTQKVVVRNTLDENKHMMLEFYEKHDKSKVSTIDSLLENFSIAELLDALFDKYCDAPALREWRTTH